MNYSVWSSGQHAQDGGCSKAARFGLWLLLTLLVTSTSTLAQLSSADRPTPPPVSGRRLSAPETITPADVLSRLELLRAEVDLLGAYVGRLGRPSSYLEVEDAQPREVYFQATNLYAQTEALAFQEIRRSSTYAARLDAGALRPFDVFEAVDQSLALVLRVKAAFGIEETVGERVSPDTTTPTDVFNTMVRAEGEIALLLDRSPSASDLYRQVTQAVHAAAALQAELTSSALPTEPAFELNKTAADVETRLFACYELIRRVATMHDIEMLKLVTDSEAMPEASLRSGPSAGRGAISRDLLAIITAELAFMHSALTDGDDIIQATHPGRRVYSHVYQRAGLLERILTELNR